jgi:hypothetical protein
MKLRIPVYLEDTLLGSLAEIAERPGMNLDELVSDLLRRELARKPGFRVPHPPRNRFSGLSHSYTLRAGFP